MTNKRKQFIDANFDELIYLYPEILDINSITPIDVFRLSHILEIPCFSYSNKLKPEYKNTNAYCYLVLNDIQHFNVSHSTNYILMNNSTDTIDTKYLYALIVYCTAFFLLRKFDNKYKQKVYKISKFNKKDVYYLMRKLCIDSKIFKNEIEKLKNQPKNTIIAKLSNLYLLPEFVILDKMKDLNL